MTKNKLCTHCKAIIDCRAEDIVNCDCTKVNISGELRVFLAKSYHKCLCNNCLGKFEQMLEFSKENQLPLRRSQMQEMTHYYMENGYFVFTELYHFLKGQCCGNGCRHCVYGFKNRYL
ncbi:cysteine-rich CWC family protein [Myroides sp. LJL119]